ncbi:radical SAM protein [bacterium]|nr:radical SAM protein [bacterium]
MNKIGCSFLEEGINFDYDTVCDCCISHNDGRGLPILIENYHGEPINWDLLFEKKQERIQKQKESTIYDCEGCYHLCEYEYTNEKKLSSFHFSHCRLCNAKCIYCSKEYSKGDLNYNTYPLIKDLIEKGYYKSNGEATFQGGEPTLMQNFDELIHLFIKNGTKVRIHSNGIRYSNTVEQALKDNKGTIVISLDTANANTFKKIKRVDAFKIVCQNIKKYAKANTQNIMIKYIIVPGYNDSIKEIDNFFKLMKKLQITKVVIDMEVKYARKYDNTNISPHIYLLYDYFEAMAQKHNMELSTYSFMLYVLRNRSIEKYSKFNNKLFFMWFFNKHVQKEKNYDYVMY